MSERKAISWNTKNFAGLQWEEPAGINLFPRLRSRYIRIFIFLQFQPDRGARVAKPGQRRQVQGLISQEFLGSNPIPRIFLKID